MNTIKFESTIDSLTNDQCTHILNRILNIETKHMYDEYECGDVDADINDLFNDFKGVLKGEQPLGDFFENHYLEEWDGESIQSFFELYEYLAEL